jgi:uncharacterized protein
VIVAETSGLLAYFQATEPQHRAASAVVDNPANEFVVSPYVIAELDYLTADRSGVDAELAMLRALATEDYALATFDADDIALAIEVIDKYADQEIGLADASIIVLADRYKTKQILTLDHRHFDVVRPLSGGRFKLLP